MLSDVPLQPLPLAHAGRATLLTGVLATGAPLHYRAWHGGRP